MSNQEKSEIEGLIERVEKRITALQGIGVDVSGLTGQLSMARELIDDEKYNDAHIFCEDLLSLAEQLALTGTEEAIPHNNEVDDKAGNDDTDNYASEETKRFSRSPITQATLTSAVDSGAIAQIIDEDAIESLLPRMENTALVRSIVQATSASVLQQLEQLKENHKGDDTACAGIEQALRHVTGEHESEGEDSLIYWLIQSLATGVVEHSIDSCAEHIQWQLQHIVEERMPMTTNTDAVSANSSDNTGNTKATDRDVEIKDPLSLRIVPTTDSAAAIKADTVTEAVETSVETTVGIARQQENSPMDEYQESDSLSDLPQIPKPGESWGDDSSFRAAIAHTETGTVEATKSATKSTANIETNSETVAETVFAATSVTAALTDITQSTATVRPHEDVYDAHDTDHEETKMETYEPATGSALKANTSVFTQMNAVSAVPEPAIDDILDTMQPHVTAAGELSTSISNASSSHNSDSSTKTEEALRVLTAMMIEQQTPVQSVVSERVVTQESMSKEDVLQHLRSALPELLQEEDIKQAVFSALAIEIMSNNSVLGAMTGLRAYMKQELLAAQEQMQGS